jgi:excisionase family DNA binding protein
MKIRESAAPVFRRLVLKELRLIRQALEVRPAVSPRLLTVPQTATYLSASVWAVRSLAWSKEVPCVRIGRRVLFDLRDLDRYIERTKE